jgi:hypothetical protein
MVCPTFLFTWLRQCVLGGRLAWSTVSLTESITLFERMTEVESNALGVATVRAKGTERKASMV